MAIIGERLPLYISYISDYGTAPAQVLVNDLAGVESKCSITEDLLPVLEADNCVFRYWEFNGVRVQAGDEITVTSDMITADSSSYVITLTAAWLVYEDETSGSYKPRVKNNNTDLQSILDKVNALPDAGSGSGTVSVTVSFSASTGGRYYYINSSDELTAVDGNSNKNTVEAMGGIILTLFEAVSISGGTYLGQAYADVYHFISDGGALVLYGDPGEDEIL